MLVAEHQEYLTIEEVARRLNVEIPTVRRWLRTRRMAGYQFGRQWRVRIEDFERFVRESRNVDDKPKADPDTEKRGIIHFPYPEQELGM